MLKKLLHRSLLSFAGLLFVGAGAVYAGEVNGKGEEIPGGDNGRSACSFSGQQDDAEEDEGLFKGDRVQSWGQLPKATKILFTLLGINPGNACNPNKAVGGD